MITYSKFKIFIKSFFAKFRKIPVNNDYKTFNVTKDYSRTDYIFNQAKPVILTKDSKGEVFIDKCEHLRIKKTEKTIENGSVSINYTEETPELMLAYQEKD